MSASASFPSDVVLVKKRLADSDSTNVVDVYDNSAGTKALKVEALGVTTDNTADRILKVYLHDGSVSHLMGSVTVPDLTGTNGATDPRVSLLSVTNLAPAGADGVPCLWIPAGCKLQASLDAALATGKYLYITGRAVSYT